MGVHYLGWVMVLHTKNGFFISLEGGEGAGKSTQLRHLSESLKADGLPVCQTREPGGTPGAEALRRQLLFGEEALSWKAEVMTHMAARCDHLDHQILPALAAGHVVVCDRFHDSTWAYQGYGIGCGEADKLSFIRSLRQLVGHEPDLTFWLDVPLEVAQRRVVQRQGPTDRYEGQAEAFHQRVREGFSQAYQQQTDRMIRVDAARSEEEVHHALYALVKERLSARGLL